MYILKKSAQKLKNISISWANAASRVIVFILW